MIGKKINQLATELAPVSTDLTIIGDPTTGVSKKITLAQLGAIFSGAVSFYTNLAAFPNPGTIDVIYCAKDTKKLYLWSGSAYVEVFPSQALLDTYQLRSEKGNANGYASLDSGGKVPISQLPSSIMEYKGTWNAATNTPTLANGTGDTGDVYLCNVAGTVNFGAGPITFAVGDYTIYSGSIWQRSSGAVGTVTSVAASITGDSVTISGSPVTTSGTLALAFAGNSTQYVNGAGNLVTFPGIINEAQNLITEVYNKTGATLTKGTVVYINGGQGNLPSVTKALATGDATSAQTYGIVRNNITNNNNGYVVVAGRISDLDTQSYTEGTQLYLSPTTAGTYTSTKPYAPNHLVYVGIVVRAHPTQGVVEVKIQNGYEMDELHNVAAQSPDNNDILQYKTATSLWTKVAGTTSNIAEGTNLYYTDARSRAALSFTAGSGAYNSTTGVITIPTNNNQITNGANYITLTSLSAGAGISYNNTTGVIASTITQYTDALARASISLTTTGTSGAATYNSTTGVLNVPQYAPDLSGYVPTSRTLTINGTAFDLSANRSWSVGTVTSVAALTIGTTGTDLSSTVANSTTTPVITLNVPTASATNRGALSSADWTTFNNKQSALTNPVTGTGTTNYIPKFTGASTIGNSQIFDNGSTVFVNTTTAPGLNAPKLIIKMASALSYEGIIVASSSNNNIIAIAHTGTQGIITTNWGSGGATTPLAFGTSGAAQMTLDASGNLGLGVTPSAWGAATTPALQVTSAALFNLTSGGNRTYFTSNAFFNGTNFIYLNSTSANMYLQYDGSHQWHQAPSGTAGNAISFTQAMTLDASGNLMLGGTTQLGKATIIGNNNDANSGQLVIAGSTSTNKRTSIGYNTTGNYGFISVYTALSGYDALALQPNGGNVGIGTTLPSVKLQVISSLNSDVAIFSGANLTRGLKISTAAGTDNDDIAILNAQASTGTLAFQTASATKMTLSNSGNLGLGVTPTNGTGDVKHIEISSGGRFVAAGNNGEIGTNYYYDSAYKYITTNAVTRLEMNGGAFKFYNAISGSANAAITFTQAMTLNASGNLLVGNTSSVHATTGRGVIEVNGTTSILGLTINGAAAGYLYHGGTNLSVWNSLNGAIEFGTNNTTRLTIASTGAATFSSSIKTGAPSLGAAQPWKLGEAVSGSTSTNYYIKVEINGQIYSIPALQGTP